MLTPVYAEASDQERTRLKGDAGQVTPSVQFTLAFYSPCPEALLHRETM